MGLKGVRFRIPGSRCWFVFWFSGCGIGCRCLACRAQGLGFRIRLTSEWLDARNARTLLKPSHGFAMLPVVLRVRTVTAC